MIKIGDIINGRVVTDVFMLCGMEAYQSKPVTGKTETETTFPINPPEKNENEDDELIIEKPRRGRRRKEV